MSEPSSQAAAAESPWMYVGENAYRRGRRLSVGGQALVYEGTRVADGRRVAIKVGTEGYPVNRPRLEREAKILGMVRSPHVIELLDCGEVTGGPHAAAYCLVTPYIERDLQKFVAAQPRKRLDAGGALRIVSHVLQGLADLHRHDVLHRDVKPSNILVSEGSAVLCDLGIAKAEGTSLTEPGWGPGTARYLAMEQYEGQAEKGSDVFSAALVLGFCVLGRDPWKRQAAAESLTEDAAVVIKAVRQALATEPDRNASAAILAFIEASLVVDPRKRPDVDATIADWEALATTEPQARRALLRATGRRPPPPAKRPTSILVADEAGDPWLHLAGGASRPIDLGELPRWADHPVLARVTIRCLRAPDLWQVDVPSYSLTWESKTRRNRIEVEVSATGAAISIGDRRRPGPPAELVLAVPRQRSCPHGKTARPGHIPLLALTAGDLALFVCHAAENRS